MAEVQTAPLMDYKTAIAGLDPEALEIACGILALCAQHDVHPDRVLSALEYFVKEIHRQENAARDDDGESFATTPDRWVSYQGPRQGKGWKNLRTGEILYQERRPGQVEGRLAALGGAVARLFGKDKQPKYAPAIRTTEGLEKRAAANKDYQAQARKIEEKNAPIYKELADKHAMSVPELKKQIAAKMQKLADGMSVYTRVKDTTLDKILDSGRLKTQHETGESNGTYDPTLRESIENKSMGVGEETAPEHRPISAYLAPHDYAYGKSDAAANRYGGVMLKLNDSVRERSQATLGDSAQFGSNDYGVATPLKKLGHLSVDPHQLRHSGMDILDSHEKLSKVEGLSFIEALVHGGLDVKDIDEVGFRETPSKEIQDKLKKHGLKWRVYKG